MFLPLLVDLGGGLDHLDLLVVSRLDTEDASFAAVLRLQLGLVLEGVEDLVGARPDLGDDDRVSHEWALPDLAFCSHRRQPDAIWLACADIRSIPPSITKEAPVVLT